ncbi:hypothetical protein GLV94_02900 [Virgibacillus halodenitrificans]|nr:hypothetical protein [Virgibacillus halodenitrificans]MYL44581.1 hypothetical protein [Virgibacillus halodenitrificans]
MEIKWVLLKEFIKKELEEVQNDFEPITACQLLRILEYMNELDENII